MTSAWAGWERGAGQGGLRRRGRSCVRPHGWLSAAPEIRCAVPQVLVWAGFVSGDERRVLHRVTSRHNACGSATHGCQGRAAEQVGARLPARVHTGACAVVHPSVRKRVHVCCVCSGVSAVRCVCACVPVRAFRRPCACPCTRLCVQLCLDAGLCSVCAHTDAWGRMLSAGTPAGGPFQLTQLGRACVRGSVQRSDRRRGDRALCTYTVCQRPEPTGKACTCHLYNAGRNLRARARARTRRQEHAPQIAGTCRVWGAPSCVHTHACTCIHMAACAQASAG